MREEGDAGTDNNDNRTNGVPVSPTDGSVDGMIANMASTSGCAKFNTTTSSRVVPPLSVKQPACLPTENVPLPNKGTASRGGSQTSLATMRDSKGEILSESEDESPHDDPFLFRHMGRKVKDRLKKFSSSFFAPRREEEGGTSVTDGVVASENSRINSSPLASNAKVSMEENTSGSRSSSAFDLVVSGALQVPAFEIAQHRDAFYTVPMMLSLLQISLTDAPLPSAAAAAANTSPKRRASIINHLFEIDLAYGPLRWSIQRRLYDIFRLHVILSFKNVQGGMNWQLPHFPNQFAYIFDTSSLKAMSREERRAHKVRLERERCAALQKYLLRLLTALNMQSNTAEVFEFIEISRLSLQLNSRDGMFAMSTPEASVEAAEIVPRSHPTVSNKLKEGYLKNRLFDVQAHPRWYSCLLCSIPDRRRYRTKWFIIRSSYIAVVDRIDQAWPSDVLLCDKDFHTIVENERGGFGQWQFLKPLTITIVNGSRKLEVQPESNGQIDLWLEALRRLAVDCIWCHPHRFGSFAPVRYNCSLNWLIDAEEYYGALVRAIEDAREEIYLHGWWISPELYLKRPPADNPQLRLDRILQRKAREGVKIYILVFKEFSMALSLNSYHTKLSFERLHPNIRVQRHPDHFGGILYWAHHEKIVVIDQVVAFTGGLDLCFGRYDTQLHSLTDTDSAQVWTGLDYSNPRIRDFRNVIQHTTAIVDRTTVPRMPWHDVHIRITGDPARDLARHFIERWNYVKGKKAMHKEEHIPFLLPKPDIGPAEGIGRAASPMTRLRPEPRAGGSPLPEISSSTPPCSCPSSCSGSCSNSNSATMTIQVVRSVSEWSMGTTVENGIYDAYLYYIENARHFIYIENQFFVSRSAERQATPIRNRVIQAITERIIRAASEGALFKVIVILPLLPAFEAPLHRSEASSLRMIMQGQYSGISRGPTSLLGQLAARGIRAEDYISFLSLRKYSFLEGKAITEQVYVHSKLMIVDDEVAILGSANINDRSLLGGRDSEVALIIEDREQIPATLSGRRVTVSRRIRELRIRLLQEHLGLLQLPFADPQVELLLDPTADAFYHDVLRKQASRNTQIFRELFHCLPDDCVDSWEEYRRFTETPRVHVVDEQLGINSLEMLNAIKGNIVLFPTQFLRKEDLTASLLTFESLLPVEVYL